MRGKDLTVQADTAASHWLRHGPGVFPQDRKFGIEELIVGRPFDPQCGHFKEKRTQEKMVLLCDSDKSLLGKQWKLEPDKAT